MARAFPRGAAPVLVFTLVALAYCGVDERFRAGLGVSDAGFQTDGAGDHDAAGGEQPGGAGAGGSGGTAGASQGGSAGHGGTGQGGTGQGGTGQGGDAGTGGAGNGGQGASAGCSGTSGTGACVPEIGLKVALFGDQGATVEAANVLQLVKDEGADFVIHLGDFDYLSDPKLWEEQIDANLGADFPYFAAVGNHDVQAWPEYQRRLVARAARTPGAVCSGDYGVNSFCRYRGLYFVLSGVGTVGVDHTAFLEQALASAPDLWKICAWHKNQHDMQTGTKSDEVGWTAYQICQRYGAMIATGHEHAYSRSFTLNQLGNRAAQHGKIGPPAWLNLLPGRSFVVVSGLGGNSIRVFRPDLHPDVHWWATVYTSDTYWRNSKPITDFTPAAGALFLKFGIASDPAHAHAYFKNTRHEIIDSFDVVMGVPTAQP